MAQYPRLLGTPLAAGLPSSARYAATASVRGLLVAEIQVFVPYRIHPSIHPSLQHDAGSSWWCCCWDPCMEVPGVTLRP